MWTGRIVDPGAAGPSPGPGQVVVRVEDASGSFSDVKRRRGDPYPFPTAIPFVPGGEVAGLGPGVQGKLVLKPWM